MSFACAIRNFTPQGALLEVPAEQVLPATFALIHVAGGVAFDARLTWRKGARAGALFLARHDLRQAETPEHRQLRRIWLALAPD